MTPNDYWRECLLNSCEENGVELTDEQSVAIAADIALSHENYGMAFYTPSENPLRKELQEAKRALAEEREKVVCPECKGQRWIETPGPYHSAISQCHRCRGEGKVSP